VIAGLWLIRTGELRPAHITPKARRQVREGLRYVRGVPQLWVPLTMMALVGTLSYNFQTVFPLFTTRDLHGTGTTFTLLFSVVSVGALPAPCASPAERRSACATSPARRSATAPRWCSWRSRRTSRSRS